jgi:hypothetical protein
VQANLVGSDEIVARYPLGERILSWSLFCFSNAEDIASNHSAISDDDIMDFQLGSKPQNCPFRGAVVVVDRLEPPPTDCDGSIWRFEPVFPDDGPSPVRGSKTLLGRPPKKQLHCDIETENSFPNTSNKLLRGLARLHGSTLTVASVRDCRLGQGC